jgi:hypothetical protein
MVVLKVVSRSGKELVAGGLDVKASAAARRRPAPARRRSAAEARRPPRAAGQHGGRPEEGLPRGQQAAQGARHGCCAARLLHAPVHLPRARRGSRAAALRRQVVPNKAEYYPDRQARAARSAPGCAAFARRQP